MSGTLNNVYNNVIFAIARQTEALAKLQEQASTGSRINRPSDDPSTAYRVLTLDTENKSLENYLGAIADMSSTLETGSAIIQQMASVIGQTRNNVTQITSGTYDQQGRDRMAEAINNSLEQLVQLANTKYNGQYLFGGSDTGSLPYAVERTDGEITAVIYQGSQEARNTNVAPGVSASAYYVGDEMFRSSQRSTPVFDGTTGAAAGTGTSSVTGDVWLTATFDGTNYQVSIDDGATFVTVPPGGDANQAVTDSRTGKVLYVDTTGINNAGVELVRVPGTHDAFSTLINIRDLLKNNRNLSDSQIQQLRSASTDSLEEVQNLLIQKEVSMGSKIGFLSNLKSSIESVKSNNEDETSQLQQADIAQIAIDLSRQQALYQMSLSVAGKMMSLSLLDFITT
jgi:flagellar hook-associated protein 3 FlgL